MCRVWSSKRQQRPSKSLKVTLRLLNSILQIFNIIKTTLLTFPSNVLPCKTLISPTSKWIHKTVSSLTPNQAHASAQIQTKKVRKTHSLYYYCIKYNEQKKNFFLFFRLLFKREIYQIKHENNVWFWLIDKWKDPSDNISIFLVK